MEMLKFELLEDRIVLDGAVAHDVSDIPTAGDASPGEPVTNPNLVVVNENLRDVHTLKSSIKDDAVVLTYNDQTDDLLSLSAKISETLNGQKAASVSFVTDGSEGEFNLLHDKAVNSDTLEEKAMHDFWDNTASHIMQDGSINIIGSSVAKGDHGLEFIRKLEGLINASGDSQIAVHASTTPTGAIGLNGDWVMEYPPTGPPNEQTNPIANIFDLETISDWQGLLSAQKSSENNLLVIQGNLSDADLLENSAKDGVTVLVYEPNQSTLDSLYSSILESLNGEKADSIGFVTGGSDGRFNLLNGTAVDSQSLDNLDMQQFWHQVASNILPNGSINILGCNVGNGDIGLAFLNKFDSLLNSAGSDITVNASVDLTGNSDLGGDWSLEFSSTSQPVDAQALYFDAGVQDWNHLLAPGITATPTSGLTVNEFGTTDTFTVVLDEAPASDVIINLTLNPSDADEITLSDSDEFNQTSITLTFTTGDWSTPQTVTITGQLDTVTDGDQVIPITLDPSSSLDAGYQVLAPFDVTVTNQDVSGGERPFALQFNQTATGDVTYIGNSSLAPFDGTVTSGSQNNNEDMVWYNSDSDVNTFNSSNATLTLPTGANVLFARLYWVGGLSATGTTAATDNPLTPYDDSSVGPLDPNSRYTVLLDTPGTPGINYTTLTADQLDLETNLLHYNAYVDITSLVQAAGSGVYTVANIQSGQGDNGGASAGWSIAIAYEDPAQTTFRDLSIFDGYVSVRNSGSSVNVVLSGFRAPSAGTIDAKLTVFADEGDRGGSGDSLTVTGSNSITLSNSLNPTNDFFNSSITQLDSNGNPFLVTSRDPNFDPSLSIDIDQADFSGALANNDTSATITMTTAPSVGDNYYVSSFGTSILIHQAELDITKTVSNITAPGEDVYAGDTLEYEIAITNNGADFGDDVVLSDLIPTNSTYVSGSLEITQNPGGSTGAQTDGIGDDFADFDGSQAIFYLGAGATFSTGGTLSSGDTAIVHFRVTVDSVSAGTLISNTATSTWTNRDLANTGNSSSNPADVTVVDPPTITIADNSVSEGDSGTTNLVLTVTASSAVNRTIFFDASTSDGTATLADGDYVQLINSLFTFNPSISNGTVTIGLNGDISFEADETLTITLSSLVGANPTGSNLVAQGTILNDDVNNAPTLNTAADMNLTSIDEDYYNNPGDQISVILASDGVIPDPITDPDSIGSEGVAVIGIDNTNGRWQYSVGDHVSWTDFDPGTAFTNATLLDVGDYVRFVPDANYNGSSTITFHAWDQTNGASAGDTGVDLTGQTGSANAFSVDSNTMNLEVLQVNDQPVIANDTDPTLTDVENSDPNPSGDTIAAVLASGAVTITDADPLDVHGVAVVGVDDTNGTWEFSINGGSTWTSFTDATNPNAVSETDAVVLRPTDLVRFLPDVGYSGTVTNGLDFKAWDQSNSPGVSAGDVVDTTGYYNFGPEIRVNSSTSGSQYGPEMITIGADRHLIVWTDETGSSIRAQVVDDTGTFIGSQQTLTTGTTHSDQWGVDLLNNGNVVLTYVKLDGDAEGTFFNIYQPNLMTGTLSTVVSGTRANQTITGDQSQPDVAALSGGGFVITWSYSNTPANLSTLDLAYRVFNANGSAATNDIFVTNGNGIGEFSTRAFALDNNQFVFSWNVSPSTLNRFAVFDSGGQISNTITETDANYGFDNRGGAVLANGSIIYLWTGADSNGNGAAYRTYSFDGATITPLTSQNFINDNEVGNQLFSFQSTSVATDVGAGWLGTYYDSIGDTDGSAAVLLKLFDNNNNLVYPETIINETTTGIQGSPVVVNLVDATYMFAYSGNVVGDSSGVAIRIINLIGPQSPYSAEIESASVTVLDPPDITIDDVSQIEGNSGTTTFSFTVRLSKASPVDIDVTYSTADQTAQDENGDNDYLSSSDTLQILSGETTGTINITVNGDVTPEAHETFFVNLNSASLGTITDSQAQGTILNDDTTASIDDVSVLEGGQLSFTVTLSYASAQTVTVDYATGDGTATIADSDYTQLTTTTLTFNPNETFKNIIVQTTDDTKLESDETLFVNLTNPVNVTISDAQGLGTIL
ncbi:MAG: DUF4347 domain-containing protein, partial [Chlamydiales bacterium]|nr:DUF4347 domain-containing protein [Chlamydiales bacterium]